MTKPAIKMTFDKFHSWATGYVLFAIGEGESLRDAMRVVCNQAAMNDVWGGAKAKARKRASVQKRRK